MNPSENLYYEICNEPYFGGVLLNWQRHIARFIGKTESQLSFQHLIAQNIGNGSAAIHDPDDAVSLFNFHYSHPPDSVRLNAGLKRPIVFDETGFDGQADATYRIQGWDFLIAGGSAYGTV